MSYYYTRQGYAMMAIDAPSTHYFGGDNYHKGADCPVCNIPLLLLADLDCTVLRKTEKAKLFTKFKRLPLYYCWRCCAEELSYQVSGKSVVVFNNKGSRQGDDFPYQGFPVKFRRRPLKLIPVPYEIAKLLVINQEIDGGWISKQDEKKIQSGLKKLRHNLFGRGINRHQVGGLLNLIQGHGSVACPNPRCKAHELAKQGRAARMKELAVIHNDPNSGLPMLETLEELAKPANFNEYVQVVFWVCDECLTIAASNRCD